MDQTEIITIIIITITTILMIAIGIQLISLIRDLRKTIKKIYYSLDEEDLKKIPHKTGDKKTNKKVLIINSILDKIKVLTPDLRNKPKKVFVKEK